MVRALQLTAPRCAVFALLLALVFPVAASAQVEGLSELSDTDFIERFRTRISPDPVRFTSDPVRHSDEGKCSFHLMAEAARRLPLMSLADRQIMQALLAPPVTQTSVLSPSGRFRVHFDTTGKHAPAMLDTDGSRIPGTHAEYADSVAVLYDYAYAVEIGECGYERPPFEPGKNEYQVYIQEYGASPYYGETFYPTPIDDPVVVLPTYACYIQMDNDYSSHYSKGLDGARVTAAHEFHHVIQIGRYGLQANNAWMHEMTSSYYEEVVFPRVNDYIFYVRNFMREPDRPMHMMGDDGYDLVLWPLFLEQRFGPDILRRIWMDMQNGEPLSSMRQQIAMRLGDFSTEFCAWARSIYFTAWRTWRLDPPAYTDAELFPSVRFGATQELISGRAGFSGRLQPLSSEYVRVARGLDTVAFVISNSDLEAIGPGSTEGTGFTLDVRESAPDNSWQTLFNGWAYKFTPEVANTLCMNVLDAGVPPTDNLRPPYPNPLLLAESSRMQFPLPRNISANRVELVLLSPSMNEVYRRDNIPVLLDDTIGAYVTLDLDDAVALASGVYYYVLKYGSQQNLGKFAVIGR